MASRSKAFRIVRAIVLVLIVLVLLPYLIVPLYRFIDPPSTLMMWRRITLQRVEQTWVPLTAISPHLPRTVIASEDGQYCSHRGVDFGELRAAFREADDLSDMRGGSTIAQQTVKNLFLWQGRSYIRKVLEFPLALWANLVLGKKRMMEIYLNIAEWGPGGQFGAEAGAQHAFGKSAREVNAREAALMASILPNPVVRSAARPGSGVRRLAGIYEARARRSAAPSACIRR